MKRIHFFLIALITMVVFSANAQRSRTINWTKDGNAYYASEAGEIVKYQLPGITKTVLVEKAKFTQDSKALAVKSFSVSENEQMFLLFTNTKKVWRYETRGDYYVFIKPQAL